ncbi:hypothetical protein L202_04504 [Cryptococcus amylolentus CBS 6039]|uniref:Uncharacterized protein n=2 Tax=Cryptococcus amylolentus TaxID=104669 RepID=A0A1E3HRJ5_9TREE|nr:hypothetical protein L202_04504 [Cryptococcus amylolentus CBS 6039]ODN78993.1 hypothetical protein L202_04504 [Cryptococcus amylolentus CBS 6039]
MSFPVRSHIYRKTALFPRDLIKMLEWVFDNCGDKYDEALQFAVINTLFMYAGLRPGSVLATKHYPTKFAKWGDVEFRLRPGKDGKNTDIEVIFLVNTWKGYWLDDSKRVSFKIKPVQTLKFAYLDFGTYLLAFALARGVLGDRTFEDLLAAPDVVIRAEEEFRLLPIFVTGSRTRLHDLQTAKPLVSDLVNLRLKEVLRGVGVVTPESGRGDTLYAYRRTFATLISRRMSLDAARFFMGHSPNSTAIEKYYDFGNFQANVVGGILGEGEGGADEIIPLTALARPNNEKNYTVKDALRDSPRFRNMHEKWSFLRDCLASGSGDWTKVEPFKSDPAIQTSGHIGMLPAIIAAYKSQMRAFVVSLRKQQWASDAEKNEVEMEAAQFARLQRPVSEEETGEEVSRSSLLHSLQQALWEKERAFVREAINHDTDQTYEISPDSGLELAEGDDIENDDKSNAGDDEGLDLEQGGAEDVERVVDGEDGGESEWEDVEEGMDGDDAKEGVEKEGEGDVEAVEQVVQPLELKDCQTTKLELLRTLVQLCANQADSKNPQPCEECLDDPLVPDEQAPLFRPGEKLKRHLIQFHSPHLRCDRWLKSLIDEDGAYVCPLQVEASEHSSVAGSEAEGQRDLICGKSLKNEKHFRKHLFDLHQNQLHPDFLRPLNPSTRNASRSDANKKHEEITNRPRDRKVGVKRGPMYDFGTPGMFQHQDHTELGELGLGDSLFETGDIAPVKEWGFMLDEEGLLKL